MPDNNEPCPVTGLTCNECHIACHMQMRVGEFAMNAMSDAEKHAKAMRETGFHAVFLPANLYHAAVQKGYDMTRYVIQHMLPTSEQMRDATMARADAGLPLGANHNPIAPTNLTRRGNPVRKHVEEKYCGGITCLPGLGGKCVACSEDD